MRGEGRRTEEGEEKRVVGIKGKEEGGERKMRRR